MKRLLTPHWFTISTLALGLTLALGCDDETTSDADGAGGDEAGGSDSSTDNDSEIVNACGPTGQTTSADAFLVVSVAISPQNERTTYVQAIDEISEQSLSLDNAIESAGQVEVMALDDQLWVGAADKPVWQRYSINEELEFKQESAISLEKYGADRIDYGNTLVDKNTAVSVFASQAVAVVWDPQEMIIKGEVQLEHLIDPDYSLEVWTTTSHNGLVYIPGRHSNLFAGQVKENVVMTIIDPEKLEVVAIAEDERCSSGGRVVIGADCNAYVMSDGRTYSAQGLAIRKGEEPPKNCILRIPEGETDFEEDYYYNIVDITGGYEAITELEGTVPGDGFGFAKLFYPEELPDGVTATSFKFWSTPAHKLWRFELGDVPTASEITGMPFSTVGFKGSAVNGKLYSGVSPDDQTSVIYEIDPKTNEAKKTLEVLGLFNGMHGVRF